MSDFPYGISVYWFERIFKGRNLLARICRRRFGGTISTQQTTDEKRK